MKHLEDIFLHMGMRYILPKKGKQGQKDLCIDT